MTEPKAYRRQSKGGVQMTSIRTRSIRIAIATALAAAAALAGAAAAHHESGSTGAAVTAVVRPAGIVDCCL